MKMLLFILLLCIFASGQRAKIDIQEIVSTVENGSSVATVSILDDGEEVPGGYKLIAKGKTFVGPMTIKCGQRHTMQMIKKEATNLHCDAVRLYKVREPGLIHKCFKAKILFLKKME